MTRPDWRGWTLATLAIVLLLALALTADGQVRTPGVGLPGVPHTEFKRTWCQQHRPGGCSASAPSDFNCSACPSRGWVGYYAEFFPRAQSMLRGCWEADTWGTKATHDGAQTTAEFDWAQVGIPRLSSWYRECWYEREHLGGAPERAIVIATEADAQNWSFVVDAAKASGAWQEGLFSYEGFDASFGGWRAGGGWLVWVDNRLGVTPEPQPDPVPPSPTPACEPFEGSNCEARCARVRRDREWCLDPGRAGDAALIASLCSRVCRESEPPPPPQPPPPPSPECPPGAFELACQNLGISVERCRTLARWISACNPDCDPKCFVPALASTGQNVTGVVP